jgi:protocatechuate 3,4-dioxygenase beta subunit
MSALSTPMGRLAAQSLQLPLTPQCGAPEKPTRAQTEGPFFTPDTPMKRDFRRDGPGDPINLVGFVLSPDCRPVAGALIELWHADGSGRYDNRDYHFRGHQFADGQGRFVFETVMPGLYPGRTRHFHVKVQPKGGKVLTTQLYFPDEPGNRRDGIFHDSLLMQVDRAGDGMVGRYDFVVPA